MTLPAWLPIALSATGIIVALSGLLWQVRRARFNQSVDLLFRLEADFFGPAKRAQRVKAATDLLAGRFLEAEPILDFFETMALLQRRGALDQELIQHTFFFWIDRYFEASKDIIRERQSFNPLTWKDLSVFIKRLRASQNVRLGAQAYKVPGPEQIHNFLLEELTESA